MGSMTAPSALLLISIAVSCGTSKSGGGSPATTCYGGDIRSCLGPSGCRGEQTCADDGSAWSACACTADAGPTGTGGKGGSAEGGVHDGSADGSTGGALGTGGAGAGGGGSTGTGGQTGTGGAAGTGGSTGTGGATATCNSGPPTLPFDVDGYFEASGFMPDGVGLMATVGCPAQGVIAPVDLAKGKCWTIKVTRALMTSTWVGIDWQWPLNNWGLTGQTGRSLPAGATLIEFAAWGKVGGEVVDFTAGYGPGTADGFGVSLKGNVLSFRPTLYAIDMTGASYSCVISPFGFTVSPTMDMEFYIAYPQWQ